MLFLYHISFLLIAQNRFVSNSVLIAYFFKFQLSNFFTKLGLELFLVNYQVYICFLSSFDCQLFFFYSNSDISYTGFKLLKFLFVEFQMLILLSNSHSIFFVKFRQLIVFLSTTDLLFDKDFLSAFKKKKSNSEFYIKKN